MCVCVCVFLLLSHLANIGRQEGINEEQRQGRLVLTSLLSEHPSLRSLLYVYMCYSRCIRGHQCSKQCVHTVEPCLPFSFHPTSIENHCGLEQQQRMAHHMKTIFKGMLLLPGKSDISCLPSPEDLKGKIILKGTLQLHPLVELSDFTHNVVISTLQSSIWFALLILPFALCTTPTPPICRQTRCRTS